MIRANLANQSLLKFIISGFLPFAILENFHLKRFIYHISRILLILCQLNFKKFDAQNFQSSYSFDKKRLRTDQDQIYLCKSRLLDIDSKLLKHGCHHSFYQAKLLHVLSYHCN